MDVIYRSFFSALNETEADIEKSHRVFSQNPGTHAKALLFGIQDTQVYRPRWFTEPAAINLH